MKLHADKEYLYNAIVNDQKTIKELSNELKVSKHLIEIYLEKFDIPFKSHYHKP